MGTHPIFESDFDCLTDMSLVEVSEALRDLVSAHAGDSFPLPAWAGSLFVDQSTPRTDFEKLWNLIFSFHPKYKTFIADFGNHFRPSTNRKEEGIFRKAAMKFIDEQVKHKKPSFHIMDKPFGEQFLLYTIGLYYAVSGAENLELADDLDEETMADLLELDAGERCVLSQLVQSQTCESDLSERESILSRVEEEIISLDNRLLELRRERGSGDGKTGHDFAALRELNQNVPTIGAKPLTLAATARVQLANQNLVQLCRLADLATEKVPEFDIDETTRHRKILEDDRTTTLANKSNAENERNREKSRIRKPSQKEVEEAISLFKRDLLKLVPVEEPVEEDLTASTTAYSTMASISETTTNRRNRRRTDFQVSMMTAAVRREASPIRDDELDDLEVSNLSFDSDQEDENHPNWNPFANRSFHRQW